ncbi:serine hydrolase [Actinocorallia sp. B10E7]|uniref:serine hydrolase n=1 Tax=Actinocorallia sp. B10E7 TaxID=3153558 RepID=UPI00325CA153
MILRRVALGAVLVAALAFGGPDGGTPLLEAVRPEVAVAEAPEPPKVEVQPRALDSEGLDRRLKKYLAGRASGAGIMVVDRVTGLSYGFRRDEEFVTASAAKLDILMVLLQRRQKAGEKLSADERYDAGIMIRESDNKSADRLFLRAGGATSINAVNRRSFGLKHTTAIDAQCLDLLCWSLTSTTPADQVRLLQRLFTGPLSEANRGFVLDLMREVIEEQRWGVGAGALEGDAVYNKNGWMTHQRDGDRWAVNSVGRIEGHGHDLLVAVMTSHNPSMGYGITTAERLVTEVADAFRETTGP